MSGYEFCFDILDTPAPPLYDCIPIEIITKHANSFANTQRMTDAIDAERQARKFFCKTLALKYHTQQLCEAEVVPLPISEVITKNALSLIKKTSPFCFLTVNPSPEVSLETFQKSVQKFLKKKNLSFYFQVYEVRKGETGLHAHMMVKYNTPVYGFKRSTKSTFSKICAVDNTAILNFKFIAEELIPDKIKYMMGEKQDKKQNGVKDTIIWRTKYSIPTLVESSPPFPCRATQLLVAPVAALSQPEID